MSEVAVKEKSGSSLKSAARLAAVQALYQIDFETALSGAEIKDFLEKNIPQDAENNIADFDKEIFVSVVQGTLSRLADIDQILSGSLDPKWPIDRLEKILRGILRAGVAELLIQSGIDTGIIINDYVNIAHGFFAGKEPALVNAVLDKVAKTVRG
jgi:N utilization substance protein B